MSFFGLFLKTKSKNYANVIVFLFFDLGVIFFWKSRKRHFYHKGQFSLLST